MSSSFNAVPSVNPTAYLNQDEPATVLRVIAQRTPTSNDRRQKLGTIWVDQTTNQSYQLTQVSQGAANWTLLGPGASDVDTLTADSGGARSPIGGNFNLVGGSNIATAGSGATISFALDDAINVSNSVTTGLLDVDNIQINGNTISSTDTDGNINLTPDGSGAVATSALLCSGGQIDNVTIGTSTPAVATFTTATIDTQLTMNPGVEFHISGGLATDIIGTVALTNGTATVANTNIAAGDRIFFSRIGVGSSLSLGETVYTINAGVSFTITSVDPSDPTTTRTGDESTFSYIILRQI